LNKDLKGSFDYDRETNKPVQETKITDITLAHGLICGFSYWIPGICSFDY